jgi:hypothetical protein
MKNKDNKKEGKKEDILMRILILSMKLEHLEVIVS